MGNHSMNHKNYCKVERKKLESKKEKIKQEVKEEGETNIEEMQNTNFLGEDGYMTKKCPECNFSTPNPWKLRIHIRKVHKPHTCSKCDKSYTTAKSLKQHLRIHITTVPEEK